MTDKQSLIAPEAVATGLPTWLKPIADLVPETLVVMVEISPNVYVEVSAALVLVVGVCLLLRPPWRGG